MCIAVCIAVCTAVCIAVCIAECTAVSTAVCIAVCTVNDKCYDRGTVPYFGPNGSDPAVTASSTLRKGIVGTALLIVVYQVVYALGLLIGLQFYYAVFLQ